MLAQSALHTFSGNNKIQTVERSLVETERERSMWNIWREKCVFKCISIIMCKAKHWKVRSCWVVWTQANTCCLRRKTVLESPVALFIHIQLVKAKSDDCTVCHEIPCLGGFSQCYGFFPTWPNYKEKRNGFLECQWDVINRSGKWKI